MRQQILILAATLALLTPAANAQNVPVVPEQFPQSPLVLADPTIEVVRAGLPPRASKTPFAVKHPRLHRIGRKIRRTCTVLQPVASFAGSCAQIVTMFRR